jgi:hypothetical protein
VLLSRSNRTEALRKILVQRVCNNVNWMKVGSEFTSTAARHVFKEETTRQRKVWFWLPGHRLRL